MSITIHFGGKLDSLKSLDDLLAFVNYYANDKDWLCSELKEDCPQELQPWENGIILQSNPNVESICLFFDENLTLETFCKTQFGGVEAHIDVIEFLHAIEHFFLDFWVIDEGDYWTTNDELLLTEKMGIMAQILDDVEKSLRNQNKDNKWKYN